MGNEMTDFERGLYLEMAWYPPDTMLEGMGLRSFSLGSRQAMKIMGLTVMDVDHDLSLLEETQQVAAYIWLHHTDICIISRALWNGSWRGIMEGLTAPAPTVVEEFRVMAERVRSLNEASAIKILPPKITGDEEKPPPEVVGPTVFAHWMMVIMAATGRGWKDVMWQLPLSQALQIYHADMRWRGQWTARPCRVADGGDFVDFRPPED